MIIADLMTPFPKTLDSSATIQKAAQMMRDDDFGVIPIVDNAGMLVGIVTDRDIVINAIADGRGPDTPVERCMTARPDTVSKDITIEQAMTIMSSRQIRRLPVVESGRLIGMLSLSDIATSVAPADEKAKALEDVSLGTDDMRASNVYSG